MMKIEFKEQSVKLSICWYKQKKEMSLRVVLSYGIASTSPPKDGGEVKKNFPPTLSPMGGKCPKSEIYFPPIWGGSKIHKSNFPPMALSFGGEVKSTSPP